MALKPTAWADGPMQIISSMQALIVARQYGFDVVEAWVDSSELPFDAEQELKDLCNEVKVTYGAMPYRPVWGVKVRLSQPSAKALKKLLKLLGSKFQFKVTYVEAACDFITLSKKEAKKLLKLLIGHLHFCRLHSEVVPDRSSWYYARRTAGEPGDQRRNRRRTPVIPVAYVDEFSKQQGPHKGEPGCHFELRLTGSAALERAGIATLQDLIDFDHAALWIERAQLYERGEMTDLGRALRPFRKDISQSALTKRARVFIKKCTKNGVFIMHQAWIEGKRARRYWKPLDNKLLFED